MKLYVPFGTLQMEGLVCRSFSVQDVLDQVDKGGREVLGWLTT